MKNEFTVEESNLISIYTEEGTASGLGSRAKVIKSISDAMEHLEDDEMMELSLREIVKLIDMTYQEFAELEFIVAEENLNGQSMAFVAVFCFFIV